MSSAIIPFYRPISNLRNSYSPIRRNCKNKMLCRLKDIVIFVGGAFSLDMSIYIDVPRPLTNDLWVFLF